MMIRETKKRMFATGHRIEREGGYHVLVAVDDGLTGNRWSVTSDYYNVSKELLSHFLYAGSQWLAYVKTCTREQILEARRVQKS